ncbi:MAG: hypothetical protein REH83_02795 [Rickettsiella sp.]|nr:hypothetical protein [Rickettsiella sp.]
MNANNPLKLEEDEDLNNKFSKINEKFKAMDLRIDELNEQIKNILKLELSIDWKNI